MKLPPNIPTALVFTFLFSLQVPLRLAAPLSHDKLFPKPVIPLTLPQIHYERIDNGRMATRHSNPNSNKEFSSPLLLSLPVPLPSHLQKSGNALWDATAPWKPSQPKRESVSAGPPRPRTRSTSRPGRYPRPLKHLFAHSYRHSSSSTGRGVVDYSDFDFDPNNNNNNVPIKRTLSETADDDLNLNSFDLFSNTGLGGGTSGVNLLKTITIEPTLTINSTSIQRLGPPAPGRPGAGSYLAAMNMGGAAPRPREAPSWERRRRRRSRGWEGENESGGNEIGNEAPPTGSFMNRRVSGRIEKRLGVEKREMMATATEQTGIIDENIKRVEKETKEQSKAGRGSRIHGRYHEALTSVAAAAAAA
ncbi:hypothetical protein GE21DRAFT_1570 [Neurospora crassa]|uniref:Uncharacterized protein n=1 Tax=Neurospora crassa (strain ATCC 24698 / 74-OR23-1A / CBS 708.71 / DSM 1257 / FGSC 987) TaxID=367110 RepID=Q7S397_NEUCR|nr:hypothetical protein NCU09225 [Neurospora crassa OR74A]EAA29933.1 hypothetical protein NCU09225 [Neurospora crassa OR74A]KHE88395.1 hypothetical protein GE21DRAFT_1570 [Neurospora crassa]|eukprot:XP_959169.1 hypothetical protein NCU09225 [Neurospora crassa OR74A]